MTGHVEHIAFAAFKDSVSPGEGKNIDASSQVLQEASFWYWGRSIASMRSELSQPADSTLGIE